MIKAFHIPDTNCLTFQTARTGKGPRLVSVAAMTALLMLSANSAMAVKCFDSEREWTGHVAYPKTINFEDAVVDNLIGSTYLAQGVTFGPHNGGDAVTEAFFASPISPINSFNVNGLDRPNGYAGGGTHITFSAPALPVEGVGILYNDAQYPGSKLTVVTSNGVTEMKDFTLGEYEVHFVGCVAEPGDGSITDAYLEVSDIDRVIFDDLRISQPCGKDL